eukprot:CAMPEP_0115038940 /NCGR_PEP_ID=MMETSP0216-20121206/43710_1 /TAXON_ID=223996 /ORGANISM="Protocruzia adherens, Strain Boccale" /LENGTH=179 /DNA_ID=CAMNT_0002419441 /DNA_START=109 /DNA_END=645 /DNA_ORIENTATION=-
MASPKDPKSNLDEDFKKSVKVTESSQSSEVASTADTKEKEADDSTKVETTTPTIKEEVKKNETEGTATPDGKKTPSSTEATSTSKSSTTNSAVKRKNPFDIMMGRTPASAAKNKVLKSDEKVTPTSHSVARDPGSSDFPGFNEFINGMGDEWKEGLSEFVYGAQMQGIYNYVQNAYATQ